LERSDKSSVPLRSRTLAWLGFWGLMFVATHVPLGGAGELRVPHGDKVVHFGMFFLLALLGSWRLAGRGLLTWRRLLAWGLAYAMYAVIDESLQPLVGRTASLSDWLADVAGVAVAQLLVGLRLRNSGARSPL
jgi:VanZ family protein